MIRQQRSFGIVSSHAPVRGHQELDVLYWYPIYVSSHAPVRGHPYPANILPPPELFQVMPP